MKSKSESALSDKNLSSQASSDASGVQAIETGMRLLGALAQPGAPQMLKTLAERAGMPPAKAHRYLVSFARTGLVQRDPATGRYLLGPAAVQIGLAALQLLDPVRVATPMLPHIRDELEELAALAIWGDYGPTIVRSEEPLRPVLVSVRPGFVLPLLASASGKVFAAWLPRTITGPYIERELAEARIRDTKGIPKTMAQVESLLDEVRRHGMGRQTGELNAGFHGLSAPVFDHHGALVAAIATVGPAGGLDIRWNGRTARKLRTAAQKVSHVLGRVPQEPGAEDKRGPSRQATP